MHASLNDDAFNDDAFNDATLLMTTLLMTTLLMTTLLMTTLLMTTLSASLLSASLSASLLSASLLSASLSASLLTTAELGGSKLNLGAAAVRHSRNGRGAQGAQHGTAALLITLLLERFCCLAKNLFGVHSGVRLSKCGHVFDPCSCHCLYKYEI